jgi:arabinogalactan oligomer/maltooligosaccharide transport system substrate-binding protein
VKRFVLLICAVFLLTLPCFAKGGRQSAGGEEGDGLTGRLTLWLDNEAWAREVISAFRKKHPGIRVNYQIVGSIDSRPKVVLEGPSGFGPDVFIMAHDHMGNAVLDNICEPFPPELQQKYADLMLDTSVKSATFEGSLYGVPLSTENIAFFYNKSLLGNNPVPQTFEDIIEFAKKWNASGRNRYALRWQLDDAYHNYFFLTAFGAALFGPDMNDYRQPGWDSDAARQGVEYYKSLHQYFDVKVSDASYDATVGAFQRGEVPFTITGPWAIADMKRNRVNFGVTKLPAIGGKQPRCFSGNIVAAVSSYSQNKEAAFALADFLASPEGETIMFKTQGKLAAYKDISSIEGLRDDPYLRGILEQSPYADPMPSIPEMAYAWDALKNLFSLSWDNLTTVSEAQKRAMEIYDTALMMSGKSR